MTIDVSRYVTVDELQLQLEFVTPAFLGGADQNAELRPASCKGMLRYWWRVLYGAKYGTDIYKEEGDRFGTTDNKHSKASVVSIQLIAPHIESQNSGFTGKLITVSHEGKSFPINILDYLAYGKYDYQKGAGNVYHSSHITNGSTFTLLVRSPKLYSEEVFQSVLALINFGSIGSRSRNGFGSMRIISSNQKTNLEPTKWFISHAPIQYSSLSNESKLFITKQSFVSWEDALSEIGIIYKNARTSLEEKHHFERRGLISRPIEVKGEYNIPQEVKIGRHPKFTFLHVTKTNDNKFQGQIVTLPIQFYEPNKQTDYKKMVNDFHTELAKQMTQKAIGGLK